MDAALWDRLRANHLTLDGTQEPLEFDKHEVERFYLPLAQRLLANAGDQPRYMLAIAGPPGSGKSAFTGLLCAVINACAAKPLAAAIGLDGWHFSNAYLDGHTALLDGAPFPLRLFKGSPRSFDAAAAYACLRGVRDGSITTYPVYSRARHDPIPDGGHLTQEQRIILVEGNYLLLATPPWAQFADLFNLRILLTAPHNALEDAIRQRHLRGGKDPAVVQRQLDLVDLPDIDLVLDHSIRPDILIEKSDSRKIVGINEGSHLPPPNDFVSGNTAPK